MEMKFLPLTSVSPIFIPQMSPMNWIILFSFFSFCFVLTMTKISLMND